MLARAITNAAGLKAGQVGEVNGNDPYVRAALRDGYLERADEADLEAAGGARTASGEPLTDDGD